MVLFSTGGLTIQCSYNDNNWLSSLVESGEGINKEMHWDYESNGKTIITFLPDNQRVEVIHDFCLKVASVLPLDDNRGQIKVMEKIWEDELNIIQADQVSMQGNGTTV